MKHKHTEMIKAKADNMNLTMFIKEYDGWVKNTEIYPVEEYPLTEDKEYFLCLPEHYKECQHWLNGGDVLSLNSYDNWFTLESYENNPSWGANSVWMSDCFTVKIKRGKEKRYVLIHNGSLVNELYSSDYDIRMSYGNEYDKLQIFEIKIEV